MAVLPIRISGDPVLHSPARAVEQIDDELRTLVADMFETMDAAPGVGLAAPQVGVPLRLFVYGWTDDDEVEHRGVAVNPELFITPTSTEPADPDAESEGCLSFPGERFPLARGARAVLRATDLEGAHYELEVDGWLARIFQHEFDHLEGRLYVDRLGRPFDRVAQKIERKRGWGVAGLSWLPGRDDLDA
ncbi:peptide deformylase [Herbiconiux sp. KACC 21604]|uniref:peptide deformylase n=1 Tax=unclassified Herbiconiux TaxID=2618217 RepID=UPI001492D799|nr:peptide deformylase [Herbiconiux sp. SALV-R1]QJU53704.1 peptide deformylase [Herbiconiux sp. SALV-R1]WPO84706.1 peptide deformylase [Herbiconiux sp. KACC 21604]